MIWRRASAQREAQAAFGDGTVFLERYVRRARHIEVQILGDQHGTVVHLGERECSIQRRHQKVLEEAPSSVISPEVRARLGAAAVDAAVAVNYHNAGTVEFLFDDATGEFWFLEMNTRLQVEHPVTEAITGLDLVREQLRVAQGEPLGYGQNDVTLSGHAIEVRLYAEDPAKDFLPAIGTVRMWEPASSPVVRFDSGIETGSVVGVEFDPLLAKVIARAPTRREAALKLALALERTVVAGLVTNRDFLVATLRHPAFLAGDTTTDFIERHAPSRNRTPSNAELFQAGVATVLWQQAVNRGLASVLSSVSSGWRNSRMPPQRLELVDGVVEYQAERGGGFVVSAFGSSARAKVLRGDATSIDFELEGRRLSAQVHQGENTAVVVFPGGVVTLELAARFPIPTIEGPAGGLVAPMPGKVLEVRAAVGDRVTAGAVLVVMEAMKMEHHLSSPADGVVIEVRVAVADQVDNGYVLLVLEAAAEVC